MLIKNYGLFWRRDAIYWGRGSNSGHLLGVPANKRTGKPINFREQQGVYILYDETFQVVYVGQAGAGIKQRLLQRLGHHRVDQLADRWTKFSWFGVRSVNRTGDLRAEAAAAHPSTTSILNHIEAILIVAAEPRHNRQGGKFGKGVIQYLQHRDEDAVGPDQETMIREIWQQKAPSE